MSKDFYEILGVGKGASQGEIKKTYRKLARKWHPDINPGNRDAEQKFKEISEAYECLGKEEKRKLYDEFGEDALKTGFDAEKAREYRQWQSAGHGGAGTNAGRYEKYEDIFDDLFGFGGRKGGFGTAASKGRDMEYPMTIDLVSALKGFETELSMEKMKVCPQCQGSGNDSEAGITTCSSCGGSGRMDVAQGPMQFTKPCPVCHGHGQVGKDCKKCSGSGRVRDRGRIRVTIPPGVKEGSKVRVAGKGEEGLSGGPAGDLYLLIHIKPHPFLNREGDRLYMEVPVTVREAMAGGEINIPTIEGRVNVKVPPGSQNGQTLRLKGKGPVDPKTKVRGDLMVKLIVKVPKTDDPEMIKAVERLDGFYDGDVRAGIHL